MSRRTTVRVVLTPKCITSRAAAQEASAWMEELVRTAGLRPEDRVYIPDPAGEWTSSDVGHLCTGQLEAEAEAASRSDASTGAGALRAAADGSPCERQVAEAAPGGPAGGSRRSARWRAGTPT